MRVTNHNSFLALIITGVLAIFQVTQSGVSAQTPKGVLKAAVHYGSSADWFDPATVNPQFTSLFVMYLFHDSLLKPMSGDLYAPCLAESWTISRDAKVYEFKLRKGVKFHNGDTLSAEDVVFSFWRYKAAGAKLIHDKTEKVEAVNPYLVRYRFKEPFPNFLEYFLPGLASIGWVAPKKYIEKVGESEFKKNPIGCGPYKFVEFIPGVKLVAEAFEGFWRKVPKVKRLEIYNVMEAATRYAMVTRGEMDIATYLVDVYYQKVKSDPHLKLFTPLSSNRWLINMTSQWDPKSPWSDPRVRKAASLAIDRKTLADVNMPGCGPIGSLGLEADPEVVPFPPDPYDPGQAKRLLAEARYPNGFQGGTFYPMDGPHWNMGEMIVNYWKAVGITVNPILLDRVAWWAQRMGGKMKGAIFNDTIGAPTLGSRLALLFTPPQSYGNYPDIQILWDQYQKEVEPKVRKDLLARIQRLIYDKTMFIPLSSMNSPAAAGPRVKGNPFKIQEPFPVYLICPLEDLELNE